MNESFPELDFQRKKGPFYYFDSAATTLKPASVIRAISEHYSQSNANTRRGFYPLAVQADGICESVREKVRDFIGAEYITECIFTHGATEGLNILARSITNSFLKPDDEVVVSQLEHHSSLLPWRALEKEGKIKVKILPYNFAKGKIQTQDLEKLITSRAKVLVLAPESNVLGQTRNFAELVKIAKEHNLIVVADCAQLVAHQELQLTNRDIDFAVFSGHKMYAEMGIGVLYGRQELLEKMEPSFYGGEMVENVEISDKIQLAELPYRFEAGTINLGGIVSLGAAIDFMRSQNIHNFNHLAAYLNEKLLQIPNLGVISDPRSPIQSFIIQNVHSHDIAQILASDGICVRAGYHCAQPLLEKIGPVTRVSLGFYNAEEDIDYLAEKLATVRKRMGYE